MKRLLFALLALACLGVGPASPVSATPDAAPINLHPEINGLTETLLRWEQPPGTSAATYRVETTDDGGATWQPILLTAPDGQAYQSWQHKISLYIAEPLTLTWRVVAIDVDPGGGDATSDPVTSVIVPQAVGAPTNVTTAVGTEDVTITWDDDPVEDPKTSTPLRQVAVNEGYVVERLEGSAWVAAEGSFDPADPRMFHWSLPDGVPAQTVSFRVIAQASYSGVDYVSPPSAAAEAAFAGRPAAPTNLDMHLTYDPQSPEFAEGFGTIAASWSYEESGTPVDYFRVDVREANATFEGPHGAIDYYRLDGDLRQLTGPYPLPSGTFPEDRYYRLVAVDTAGNTSHASNIAWVQAPGTASPQLIEPTTFKVVGDPAGEVVATHEDLEDAGFGTFFDGNLGFTPRSDGRVDMWGPNNIGTAHVVGTRDTPIDQVAALEVPLPAPVDETPAPDDIAHGIGGVIHRFNATQWMMIYHREAYTNGQDQPPSMITLGVAYSPDAGATWSVRGDVITPYGGAGHGMGAGPIAEVDGSLYLYFSDSGYTPEHSGSAVARVDEADALAALEAGHAPLFEKRNVDASGLVSWEPGIGGSSTEVTVTSTQAPSEATPMAITDVIYNACTNDYIGVGGGTTIWNGSEFQGTWDGPPPEGSYSSTELAISSDGVTWHDRQLISVVAGEQIYWSAAARDQRDPKTITDGRFDIFQVHSARGPFRWGDNDMRRLSVVDKRVQTGCIDESGAIETDTRPTLSVAPITTGLETDAPQMGATGTGFTFTLSRPAATDVYVKYWAEAGTAQSNIDFVPAGSRAVPKSYKIPAGQVQGSVVVQHKADEAAEPGDEYFRLHITTATPGIRLGHIVAKGTILDAESRRQSTASDPDGEAFLSISPTPSVVEGDVGNRKMQLTVQLSRPVASPVTVKFNTYNLTAIAGTGSSGDYTALVNRSYTIPAGSLAVSVDLAVKPNLLPSARKTFGYSYVVTAAPPSLILPTHPIIATIYDDDA